MSSLIVWLCIIAGSIVLDQVTKLLVVRYLMDNSPVTVIDGVFRFSYVENPGAAFGSLSEHRWVFMVISTVAIIGLLAYLIWRKPKDRLFGVALSLVIGGGIGNMIDRVRLGYVVDFLDFCAFDFWQWVFNVADACVCVGGGMLVLWCILSMVRESKAKKSEAGGESQKADGKEEHGEHGGSGAQEEREESAGKPEEKSGGNAPH